ncbi:unnamed protein product [Peniophora sp. CBMAI 1063]|nr:unnamed protein product [Peniophora sp. CBMAI 1063]
MANTTIPSADALHVNPPSIVGPIFIGQSLNWALFGTLAVQLYIFEKSRQHTTYPLWMRTLVWSIFVVDAIQTGFMIQYSWFYSVDIWGDVVTLATRVPTSAGLLTFFDGLIALMVQSLYAWRIWVLARSRTLRALASIVVLLSLMQFGASIQVPIVNVRVHGSTVGFAQIRASVDVWLIGGFTGDIIIAGCMIYVLYRARSQTTWLQSQTLYDRLIANTVQTGLLTMVVAGLTLALWKIYPVDLIYVTPGMILGKLYSNSFLSALNSRTFREDNSVQDSSELPTHQRSGLSRLWAPKGRSTTTSGTGSTGIHVHVLRDRERHVDGASSGCLSVASRGLGGHDEPRRANDRKETVTSDGTGSEERVIELSTFSNIPVSDDTVKTCI